MGQTKQEIADEFVQLIGKIAAMPPNERTKLFDTHPGLKEAVTQGMPVVGCACCGVTTIEFLVPESGKIRLCHNCKLAITKYGACPHEACRQQERKAPIDSITLQEIAESEPWTARLIADSRNGIYETMSWERTPQIIEPDVTWFGAPVLGRMLSPLSSLGPFRRGGVVLEKSTKIEWVCGPLFDCGVWLGRRDRKRPESQWLGGPLTQYYNKFNIIFRD